MQVTRLLGQRLALQAVPSEGACCSTPTLHSNRQLKAF